MSSDFTVLLGMRLDDVAKTELVRPLLAGSKTDLIGDRFHLMMPSHGIEFVADFDGRVSTIFFFSADMQDHTQFAGSLPDNVRFGDSQNSLHNQLGQPSDCGGGDVIQFFGKVPTWDRYDRERYSLHIQYREGEGAISLVSLMRPDSIPC